MRFEDALDALANDPHQWRYRQLCADEWPGVTPAQRDAYRGQVIELAGGSPAPYRLPSPDRADLARVDAAYAAHGTGPRRTGGCGHPC